MSENIRIPVTYSPSSITNVSCIELTPEQCAEIVAKAGLYRERQMMEGNGWPPPLDPPKDRKEALLRHKILMSNLQPSESDIRRDLAYIDQQFPEQGEADGAIREVQKIINAGDCFHDEYGEARDVVNAIRAGKIPGIVDARNVSFLYQKARDEIDRLKKELAEAKARRFMVKLPSCNNAQYHMPTTPVYSAGCVRDAIREAGGEVV